MNTIFVHKTLTTTAVMTARLDVTICGMAIERSTLKVQVPWITTSSHKAHNFSMLLVLVVRHKIDISSASSAMPKYKSKTTSIRKLFFFFNAKWKKLKGERRRREMRAQRLEPIKPSSSASASWHDVHTFVLARWFRSLYIYFYRVRSSFSPITLPRTLCPSL